MVMYRPKRIYCLAYLITGIFVFVVAVYGFHIREKGASIGRYIRSISTYQPLTGVPASDSIDTPTTSCVTGRPCQYQDQVDLRVIVITFNRPDSLSKLLRSLDTLVLDGDRAALELWIDRHRKNGVDKRTLEVASAFKWKGGPTRVHVQVGYRCPIIQAGVLVLYKSAIGYQPFLIAVMYENDYCLLYRSLHFPSLF